MQSIELEPKVRIGLGTKGRTAGTVRQDVSLSSLSKDCFEMRHSPLNQPYITTKSNISRLRIRTSFILCLLLTLSKWTGSFIITAQAEDSFTKEIATALKNTNNVFGRNEKNTTKVIAYRTKKRRRSCSICKQGEIMFRPENMVSSINKLLDLSLPESVQNCAALEQRAQRGIFSAQQCQDFIMSTTVSELCGCGRYERNNNKTNLNYHENNTNTTAEQLTSNPVDETNQDTSDSHMFTISVENSTSAMYDTKSDIYRVKDSAQVVVRLMGVTKLMNNATIHTYTAKVKALLETYRQNNGDDKKRVGAFQNVRVNLVEQKLFLQVPPTVHKKARYLLRKQEENLRHQRIQYVSLTRSLSENSFIQLKSIQANRQNVQYYSLETILNITGFFRQTSLTSTDLTRIITTNQAVLIKKLQEGKYGSYFHTVNEIFNPILKTESDSTSPPKISVQSHHWEIPYISVETRNLIIIIISIVIAVLVLCCCLATDFFGLNILRFRVKGVMDLQKNSNVGHVSFPAYDQSMIRYKEPADDDDSFMHMIKKSQEIKTNYSIDSFSLYYDTSVMDSESTDDKDISGFDHTDDSLMGLKTEATERANNKAKIRKRCNKTDSSASTNHESLSVAATELTTTITSASSSGIGGDFSSCSDSSISYPSTDSNCLIRRGDGDQNGRYFFDSVPKVRPFISATSFDHDDYGSYLSSSSSESDDSTYEKSLKRVDTLSDSVISTESSSTSSSSSSFQLSKSSYIGARLGEILKVTIPPLEKVYSTKPARDTKKEHSMTRTVRAPSGKLGIGIEATVVGPVVFEVDEESPLVGKLFPKDVIIAIDDIYTQGMTSEGIAELLLRTSKSPRKFTIVRDDVCVLA